MRFAPSGLLGVIAFAALAMLCEHSGLDLRVLDAFYDPAFAGFPARRAWWAQTLLHDGQARLILLIALAALGVFAGSFFVERLRRWRRAALYLVACIALTTATVGLLKQQSSRDCPWDLERYGGTREYAPAFAPRAVDVPPGRCFPGGHSSGAFSLSGFVLLLGGLGRRRGRATLAGVLAVGFGYAATQWLRGAHFPSHDLWSAAIAWGWAHALAPILERSTVPTALGARAGTAVALLAIAGLLVVAPQRADAAEPPIHDIAFRGNDVTKPQVMLREVSIAIGDAADPAAIERSRQAILDLGLFRSVETLQEPLADGVRVVFVVKEKWYLLPYPRVSANSDGQDAIGGELRWNNAFGLNHSLRAMVTSADRAEEGRGRQLGYLVAYEAPFLFGSPYTASLRGSHTTTPITPEGVTAYDETIDELQLLASRKVFGGGPASQGWSAGGGLLWRSQHTAGIDAPPEWGDTYALVTQLGYRDEHDHLYSETGTRVATRYEYADRQLLSDYSYSRLTASLKRSIPLGATPHQTLEFAASIGAANGGRSETPPFSLGGTQGLRGYARNSFRGNAYYLASASYLRPIGWDWLRLVATIEAGNVYEEAEDINADIRWSFGLGLRIRVPRLVGVEIETGIAFPLRNDSARFYGYRGGF